MPFEGKNLLVTGAASGIGRAIARRFHADNARVVAMDVNRSDLERLAEELPGITTVTGDVSSPEDVRRAVNAAEAPIDILCNNAGVLGELKPLDEMTFDQWNRVMGVNVNGAFLFCQAVIPGMVANGGGVVVNMASVCGLRGGRAGIGYTTTKHALIGLTRNIAATYRSDGIRANSICPGSVRGGARGGRTPGASDSERGLALYIGRDRVQTRPGSPEKIAAIVRFLASDAASEINGTEIVADQGALTF